jgi:uncharacterized membrane protein
MLPEELIALIHHTELNKAGWWNKAIQQLILSAILLNDNKPQSLPDILKFLKAKLKVSIDKLKCEEQLDSLVNENKIVCFENGYKISESTFHEIQKEIDETKKIEQEVKDLFVSLVHKHCSPSLGATQVWLEFNEKFLYPFVSEMGAYTFHFITTGAQTPKLDQTAKSCFTAFASNYPAYTKKLQEVVFEFLNPQNSYVRSYILQILNSYFYVEACGVKPEILEKLVKFTQSKPSFNIFVDTNFLFSILNLHDNPSNEAAEALMKLCKRLSPTVTVKFYVTHLTLEEAKQVISSVKKYLSKIRLNPNFATAYLSTMSGGIARKFLEAYEQNPLLNVESFFSPYINNLISIVRQKGIEFYNEKLDEYKRKQEVIEDVEEQSRFIEEQMKFLKPKFRAKLPKVILHDVILWHFVRDKRPALVESPIEAKYWIVTVDYRFLGFDSYKTKGRNPICVHPMMLIQMLQFWVPRTEILDEAQLANLRLPLLFSRFDAEAERVAMAILGVLGRFENAEDLSVETIASLLVNETLRARMQTTPKLENQIQLIKDALIEEQKKLQEELKERERKLKQKEKETMEKEETIRKLEEKIKQEEELRKSTEKRLQRAEEEIEKWKVKFEEEERRRQVEERHRVHRNFLILWLALPLFIILLIASVLMFVLKLRLIWLITIVGILLIVWVLLFDHKAKKKLINHPVVERIHKFKAWLIGTIIVGSVVEHTIRELAWEWIKSLIKLIKKVF